jgi:hypothetical protein
LLENVLKVDVTGEIVEDIVMIVMIIEVVVVDIETVVTEAGTVETMTVVMVADSQGTNASSAIDSGILQEIVKKKIVVTSAMVLATWLEIVATRVTSHLAIIAKSLGIWLVIVQMVIVEIQDVVVVVT